MKTKHGSLNHIQVRGLNLEEQNGIKVLEGTNVLNRKPRVPRQKEGKKENIYQ